MALAQKKRPGHTSNNLFVGGLVAGWGVFNFTDSVFNHYIFRFHDVKEIDSDPELWNAGFLAVSIVLVATGWLVMKRK